MARYKIDEMPEEWHSTSRMLECAFPDEVGEEEYPALLFVLSQDMSRRVLATIVSYFTGKSYAEALHDVYCVLGHPPEHRDIEAIKNRLTPCGYEAWLREE